MLKSPQHCYCLVLVVSLVVFVVVVVFVELLDDVALVVPLVDALVDDELLLESVPLADELVVARAAGRCTRSW